MSRIFTFGCSFTNYEWPTWADIIIFNNDGYNMGVSGSGNESMLYRIMEADRKFNFTKEDQIIVMFTTPIRWDLITGDDPMFLGYGQVTNVEEISKYEGKLYTIEGLCYKSYYSIMAIKNYLENKKINYLFGSILDIFEDVDNYFKVVNVGNELRDLMDYVKSDVKFELPNMYDFLNINGFIKDKSWGISKKWDGYNDYHPRPHHHYKYVIENIIPKTNISLKMDVEYINNFESEIDVATNMSNYLNSFNEKYPTILNKKYSADIFYKK